MKKRFPIKIYYGDDDQPIEDIMTVSDIEEMLAVYGRKKIPVKIALVSNDATQAWVSPPDWKPQMKVLRTTEIILEADD